MSETNPPSSTYFVFILFAAVAFAAMFIPGFRNYRRRLRRPDSEPPAGAPPEATFVEETPPRVPPKLFDVYVKLGLEVGEARFKDILPMAVRIADTDMGEKPRVAPVTKTESAPPHWPLPSRSQEVGKPEAPAGEDAPETYDIAVLVLMPALHPCVADHWDEVGEYDIGTLKLAVTPSLDNSVHRGPSRSLPIS